MSIPLSDLLRIPNPTQYKVHLASYNGIIQPLEVFVKDRVEWENWNSWRSNTDQFNRDYILALADFYLETDVWLFGGIYKVIGRQPVNQSRSYTVDRAVEGQELIGRLKIHFVRPSRMRSLKLEKYFPKMSVSELLKEPYAGEKFPGYEKMSYEFSMLETVFLTERADWKAALEIVKGVYLIVDTSNGKKYVGSANGAFGIWSRWRSYIETGHGGNVELIHLIKKEGIDYARRNFRITLLEYLPFKTVDDDIWTREKYWKMALLSRAHGYNKN